MPLGNLVEFSLFLWSRSSIFLEFVQVIPGLFAEVPLAPSEVSSEKLLGVYLGFQYMIEVGPEIPPWVIFFHIPKGILLHKFH